MGSPPPGGDGGLPPPGHICAMSPSPKSVVTVRPSGFTMSTLDATHPQSRRRGGIRRRGQHGPDRSAQLTGRQDVRRVQLERSRDLGLQREGSLHRNPSHVVNDLRLRIHEGGRHPAAGMVLFRRVDEHQVQDWRTGPRPDRSSTNAGSDLSQGRRPHPQGQSNSHDPRNHTRFRTARGSFISVPLQPFLRHLRAGRATATPSRRKEPARRSARGQKDFSSLPTAER